MRSFHARISHRFVLAAALLPLAGCPAKNNTDTDTDTNGTTTANTTSADESTTSDTPTAPTSEPTTSGPTTTTTTDASTGTTAGESTLDTTLDMTTGDVDPACACINPGPIGEASFTCVPTCGTLLVGCEPIPGDTDTDTGDNSGGECEFTIDEATLACALDVLIAGEGAVKWRSSSDMGFSENGGFVQALPDRQALTRSWGREDLSIQDSAAGVVPLKSVEYFQGCKDEPTLQDRYLCLRAWSDEQPTAQCDASDFGSDI